jgi:hypothetical protein
MTATVSLVGLITNEIRPSEEKLCRFSVENEAGRFYVQVGWSPKLDDLKPGDKVHISGRLHSFQFKRCRCQHVYIEPLVIITGSGDDILGSD